MKSKESFVKGIEKLSVEEMEALRRTLSERIEKVQARPERAEVLRRIEAVLEETGYALSELIDELAARSGLQAKIKRVIGKAKPKYAHPADPENLRWSGRGSRPRWVVKALTEEGLSMRDLQDAVRERK